MLIARNPRLIESPRPFLTLQTPASPPASLTPMIPSRDAASTGGTANLLASHTSSAPSPCRTNRRRSRIHRPSSFTFLTTSRKVGGGSSGRPRDRSDARSRFGNSGAIDHIDARPKTKPPSHALCWDAVSDTLRFVTPRNSGRRASKSPFSRTVFGTRAFRLI
jgi:hypothetical protein